jgi:hypothetical protein
VINRFAILLVVTKLGEQDCNGEKKKPGLFYPGAALVDGISLFGGETHD